MKKNQKIDQLLAARGLISTIWNHCLESFSLSRKFLSCCWRYLNGSDCTYMVHLTKVFFKAPCEIQFLLLQALVFAFRRCSFPKVSNSPSHCFPYSIPACLTLLKAIPSPRNLCQEKGEKESPLTSSSSCARKISNEWFQENKQTNPSETPHCGYFRKLLRNFCGFMRRTEENTEPNNSCKIKV